jgi:hypothetical protein
MRKGAQAYLDNRQSRPAIQQRTRTVQHLPTRGTMDHRIGQRWRSDLPVRIAVGHGAESQPGRLVDLSRNGARVRLEGAKTQPGKALQVRFSGVAASARALIVHARDGQAGLLWIERPPWLEHLVAAVRRHPPLPDPPAPAIAPGSGGSTP